MLARMDTARARTLRFIARTQARNVLGAVLSFVYFRVIDPLTPSAFLISVVYTGTVLAGSIGGAERLSYALVGDAVNLASRIQDLTKDAGADILISATTRASLAEAVAVTALPAARVKGRSAGVEVFAVVR